MSNVLVTYHVLQLSIPFQFCAKFASVGIFQNHKIMSNNVDFVLIFVVLLPRTVLLRAPLTIIFNAVNLALLGRVNLKCIEAYAVLNWHV